MNEYKPKRKEMLSVMQKLLFEVERNTCYHEETNRGGAIWTICDSCGKKWADDEGGFQPHVDPEWLKDARTMVWNLTNNS